MEIVRPLGETKKNPGVCNGSDRDRFAYNMYLHGLQHFGIDRLLTRVHSGIERVSLSICMSSNYVYMPFIFVFVLNYPKCTDIHSASACTHVASSSTPSTYGT